ncbi:hypothetical protein HB779_06895 [Phyllobacterium sp. 628]|uniref:hypothetical protein n=1 Tax=Phyllobacterium sp. 628 TaxID=2718938 RepID=UPI0016626E39|nr:hypothetical protein [Phyllobacterium sp. 628]QND51655.1 hypothetical protein HB779_06895 [Phyllobacterium sp. 628]
MNPSPAHCTSVENPSSRWSWLGTVGRLFTRTPASAVIHADGFSDHMMRDIGFIDGRPIRGEEPAAHASLHKDIFKSPV